MRGKNIILRLVISLTFAGLIFGGMMCFNGSKGFFGKISNGMKSYNTISESELKKNQPINGTIYYIYDCIGYEYTEDDNGVKTAKSYFYTVPFEDDKVLIVKTNANSYTETQMDQLLFAPDQEEYKYLLERGVDIEGLLVKNDSDVVGFFNNWKENQDNVDLFRNDYNIDITNFEPVPYTLDLSMSMSKYTSFFFIGTGILIITIGAWVAFFIFIKGSGTRTLKAPNSYNQPYGQQSFGTSGLGTQPNFNAPMNNGASSYIPQQSNSISNQYPNTNSMQNMPAQQFSQAAAPQSGVSSYIPEQSSVSNYLPAQSNSTAANQQSFSSNVGFIPAQTHSFYNSADSFNSQSTSSFNNVSSSFNAQSTGAFNTTGSGFNAQKTDFISGNQNSQENFMSSGNQPANVNINSHTVIAAPQQEISQAAQSQSFSQAAVMQNTPSTVPQQAPIQTNSTRNDGNRVVISKSFITKKKDTNNGIDISKH
ncbi:MAG: hypothetical protein II589_05195 [Clostridia bacterium]|nr:hypothetical protein [Clostridia bacterium]